MEQIGFFLNVIMRLEKRNWTLKQIDIFLIKRSDTVTLINIREFTFITLTIFTQIIFYLCMYTYTTYLHILETKLKKKNKLEDRKKNRTLHHWRPETGIRSEEKQLCLRRIKARGTPVKMTIYNFIKAAQPLDCFVCQCPSYNTKERFTVHAKTWNNIWLVTRVYTSRHYVRIVRSAYLLDIL